MRRILLSVLLIGSMVIPMPVVATGTVQIDDTIAGLSGFASVRGVSASANLRLHLLTTDGEDIAIPVQTNANGEADVTIPGDLLQRAGTYRASVQSTTLNLTNTATFTVLPGRVDPVASTLSTDVSTLLADGKSEAIITVTLSDTYGNALAGRPVQLLSSRSDDVIEPLGQATDEHGQEQIALRTSTPGSIAIRALDLISSTPLQQTVRLTAEDRNGMGGVSNDLRTYTPPASAKTSPFRAQLVDDTTATPDTTGGDDLVDDFRVKIQPDEVKVHERIASVTITPLWNGAANSKFEAKAPVYIYSPTDPTADLPLAEPVTAEDGTESMRGTFQFRYDGESVTASIPQTILFNKVGLQVLRVEYKRSTGELVRKDVEINVTGSDEIPNSRLIDVVSPKSGDHVKGSVTISGYGPSYHTLIVYDLSSGNAVRLGTIELENNTQDPSKSVPFSETIQLPEQNQYLIQLKDSTETYESAKIDLQRNEENIPVSISFDPLNPVAGEAVTATVTSAADLKKVNMQLSTAFLDLTQTQKGLYLVDFIAPGAGNYPFTILVQAEDGSSGETTGTLPVLPQPLPAISNLRAVPKAGAIDLEWDPLGDDRVTSYVVHVGTDPNDLSIVQDTKSITAGASVGPLDSGTTYYFAVSAKAGELEGPRSAVIASTTIGWKMIVEPRLRALMLQIQAPGPVNVKQFLIKFWLASDPESFETAKIENKEFTANSLSMSYSLGDLLPGSEYHVEVTPIEMQTDGTVVQGETMKGTGTPLDDQGFDVAGTFDPSTLPGANNFPPSNGLHSSAPHTSSSGIPLPGWVALGVSVAGIGIYLRRRRRLQTAALFVRRMERQYQGVR